MKIKQSIPALFASLLIISSCGNIKSPHHSNTQSDTLITNIVSLQKQIPLDETNQNTIEFKVRFDYPTADDSSRLANTMRSWINTILSHSDNFNTDDNGVPTTTFKGSLENGQTIANHYMQIFTKGASDDYQEYNSSYAYELNIRKLHESEKLLTCRAEAYCYLGGPHPNTSTDFASIRKSDGHILTWDDLFTKPNIKLVATMVKNRLAQIHKENGNTDAFDDFLMLSSDEFPLPSAGPCLTPSGIEFLYNEYEIAIYAYGTPTATFKISELKKYLKPDIMKLIEP